MGVSPKAETRKPEILEAYYQVIIENGIEGASIGKIAQRMDIHPSLIIHYFKTKENLTIELLDLLIEKYEAPEFLDFNGIQDPGERFQKLMETTFSFEWSRTVDPGIHFCFYYLSFRNPEIRKRFRAMIKRFRNYLIKELTGFQESGVIRVDDVRLAADYIVTLMEGLEFHAHFLADDEPFEHFARTTRDAAIAYLTDRR
jgi:AcrR family transcriptional regulator